MFGALSPSATSTDSTCPAPQVGFLLVRTKALLVANPVWRVMQWGGHYLSHGSRELTLLHTDQGNMLGLDHTVFDIYAAGIVFAMLFEILGNNLLMTINMCAGHMFP